jgi:hypothetical protein
MSLSNPTLQSSIVIDGDAISLAILTPAVHPGSQREGTIQSSHDDPENGIQHSSESSSVRSRMQLIATLLALFVRAIPQISNRQKIPS